MGRCALFSLTINPTDVDWLPPTPLVERSATLLCATVFVVGSELFSTKLNRLPDQEHT